MKKYFITLIFLIMLILITFTNAEKGELGSPCRKDEDCLSGHCAYPGHVCCDRECNGECEYCNLPGKEGYCNYLPPGIESLKCFITGQEHCLTRMCDSEHKCEIKPENASCGYMHNCELPDGISEIYTTFCNSNGECIDYKCPVCGDGIIFKGGYDYYDKKRTYFEECDDGNLNNKDGCNAKCKIENGFFCVGEPSFCRTKFPSGFIVLFLLVIMMVYYAYKK